MFSQKSKMRQNKEKLSLKILSCKNQIDKGWGGNYYIRKLPVSILSKYLHYGILSMHNVTFSIKFLIVCKKYPNKSFQVPDGTSLFYHSFGNTSSLKITNILFIMKTEK